MKKITILILIFVVSSPDYFKTITIGIIVFN